MHNVTSKDLVPTLPQLRVLHYLISESNGKHIAHCLDLDLVATGNDIQTASRKLDDLVKAQIEFSLTTGQLANFATKAPTSYWRLFFDGKNIDLEPKTIHITIPEAAQPVAMESSVGEIGILARQQLVHAT
jgi:hypothetical protein